MQTWDAFKTQAGDVRFQSAFHAVEVAVRQLAATRDGAILSIVLFGSLARRRPTYDDIDMLIITEPGVASPSELTRHLAEEIFGPLFLQCGELFSFIVYTQAQLAQLQDILPLLDRVQREGVLLYGSDPFTRAAG